MPEVIKTSELTFKEEIETRMTKTQIKIQKKIIFIFNQEIEIKENPRYNITSIRPKKKN